MKSYNKNIDLAILGLLDTAKQNIRLNVPWFTHTPLFEKLKSHAKKGLSVEMIIEEYYEVIDEKHVIDATIAKKALQDKIRVKLLSRLPDYLNILNQDMKFYEEDNKIIGKLTIEVLEEIGVQQTIRPVD